MFRDLVLESRRTENLPPGTAAPLLAREVIEGRLILKNWDHEVEQWINRVNGLARWCPELGFQPLTAADRAAIIEQLCAEATGYKDIKDKPVLPTVKSWVNPALLPLVDKYAPERIALPGGRRAKVTYPPEGDPILAATIQDLFGLEHAPRIAMGRVALVVEILAPNRRPVQVTRDLPGFWRDHYPKIKQQLQRKYPKHPWPPIP